MSKPTQNRRRTGSIRALRALNSTDRKTVLVAGSMLALTRVALQCLRVTSVSRSLRRTASLFVRRKGDDDALRRIPWPVTTAGRHVPGGRHCLTKALVAKALLDAEGIPVRLRVGVRRGADGALQGHAWLERDGSVVMEAGEDPASFLPLSALQEAIDELG
jgi:hypothetical protein